MRHFKISDSSGSKTEADNFNFFNNFSAIQIQKVQMSQYSSGLLTSIKINTFIFLQNISVQNILKKFLTDAHCKFQSKLFGALANVWIFWYSCRVSTAHTIIPIKKPRLPEERESSWTSMHVHTLYLYLNVPEMKFFECFWNNIIVIKLNSWVM